MSINRIWRIDGILTTITPLHIGDGATTTHPKLKDGNDSIDVTSVVTDIDDRAYIPGTSIKGNIRSWLKKRCCVPPDILEGLFGSEDTENEKAVGGKAEFWNAYALQEQSILYDSPYWRLNRLTDVTVSVAIKRQTKTAIDKKLFHYEFVPQGVKFEITIVVSDAKENEIVPLICALEHGFSDDEPIILGASTSNDWGKLNWKLKNILKIDVGDVKEWVSDNSIGKKCDFAPLSENESQNLINEASKFVCSTLNKTDRININIKFKGPFLVNDPGQVKKDETADHIPRRNHQNKTVLPASSFRGAFRSQAERVMRTLGRFACCPSKPCKPDEKPCLACQIFGATGQKSLVSFTDFVQCDKEETRTQEFVAIDRFTGGGAKSLKFNADAVIDPDFEGTINIDKSRIEKWGIGLLALTLRDLKEGDITFGFGSSKGYGKCEAETDFFAQERREYLNTCVNEFREIVKKKEESHA